MENKKNNQKPNQDKDSDIRVKEESYPPSFDLTDDYKWESQSSPRGEAGPPFQNT